MSEGPVATGAAMLDAANSGSNSGDTVSAPTTTPVANNTPPAAPVQVPTGNFPNNTNTGGQKPYAAHLEKLPEGFRPMVEPIFQEWDAGVSKRFDEVHSRYAPYKQFEDAGVTPELMRDAVELHRAMIENPQRVYEALQEHLGFGQQQGGQGQVDDEFDLGSEDENSQGYDLENDPRFQALQQNQERFMQAMQQAQMQQEQRAAEAEVETLDQQVRGALEKQNIPVSNEAMRFITMSALAYREGGSGIGLDQAYAQGLQDYVNMYNGARSAPLAGQSAPLVMPTGGGTPSTGLPNFENEKDRRAAGAEMLRAAFRNG